MQNDDSIKFILFRIFCSYYVTFITELGLERNASLALYQYLCHYIVGTEDHVKQTRLMNTVKDNLSHGNTSAKITSGSFGEGIQMRGSDLDIMIICNDIEVLACEDTHIVFNPYKTYFALHPVETQPGYSRLRVVRGNIHDIRDFCEQRGRDFYFSSTAFKQAFCTYTLPIIHGPCVSDKGGFLDFAVSVHAQSWTESALKWLTRSNNGWPGNNVKQTIVQHGVLFVPVGLKGSKNQDIEWRISFSVSEKFLIYTFSHTQLLCYALMKILLKDVIAIDLEYSELLCSYFMKTIVFWISEEVSSTIWQQENLIPLFMKCFKRLIYCVEHSICPHFFITENNLFDNKIKGHAQKILLHKLNNLNSYGWRCILFSYQLSNFNFQVSYRFKNSNASFVNRVQKRLYSLTSIENCASVFFNWEKKARIALSLKSSKMKYLHWFYISKNCQRNVQFLPFYESHMRGNKSTYKQNQICISTLLRNLHHDAVSGWLLLASFFYQTKQFNLAIYIIQNALSKCTSEKMQPLKKLTHEHSELLNLNLFRKMDIVRLWKIFLADHVTSFANSTLIPIELQMEVESEFGRIQPVVYAHFLCFLCYFHLRNTRKCHDSLQDLKLTVDEKYFMVNLTDEVLSCKILGRAFQLMGDLESANQAYLQSKELKTVLSRVCH